MNRQILYIPVLCTCLVAAAGSCSDDDQPPPIPSCGVELPDGSCAGVSLEKICSDELCTQCTSCTKTPTCSSSYFVVASASSGDGTQGKPFAQIHEAAAKAKAGDCIVVGPGSYQGAKLAGGVSLLGQGAGAVTISGTAGDFALSVENGNGGVLRGFTLTGEGRGLLLKEVDGVTVEQVRVDGVRRVGLDARNSKLVLDHLQIKGTRTSSDGKFGIGLLLAEGSTASTSLVAVQGNAAQGVLVSESSIKLTSSAVLDNKKYGIAIDCINDTRCKGDLGSELSGAHISNNGLIGLWIRGAKAKVDKCAIGKTIDKTDLAREVELQGGAEVELSNSRIHGGTGLGVLVDDSSGKLVKNTIEDNEERGLWVQCTAAVNLLVQDNEVLNNKMVGIGIRNCTGVTVKGGRISGTKKVPRAVATKTAYIGDGIQVLEKSDVEVNGSTMEANERLGLVVDDAVVKATGNTISGGEGALVVQNAKVGDQTLSNNLDPDGKAIDATIPTSAFGLVPDPVALVGALPVPLP